jgi:oligopeptide transport system substrate-binding protein
MKKFYVSLLIILLNLTLSCKKDMEIDDIKPVQEIKRKTNRIRIRGTEEPVSVNPNLAQTPTGILTNSFLNEGLTKIGKDGALIPGLAERWEVSSDGKVWKFHLRDNLRWSNGDIITANDFRFSWINVLSPSTKAEYADFLYIIAGAEEYRKRKGKLADVGLKALDAKTLEITLKTPLPYLPLLLTHPVFFPVSEKFYLGSKEDFGSRPETITSSGPYILREWNAGNNLILVKNQYYWDNKSIKPEEIEIKIILDPVRALSAFNAGDIDILNLEPEFYPEYKNDSRLQKQQNGRIFYISFNVKDKIFENQKLRAAVELSIDKKELSELILEGSGKPADRFIPAIIPGFEDEEEEDSSENNYGYAPKKAKRLYANSLRELKIEKLPEIKLFIEEGFIERKVAEYVKAKLKENLDMDVEIVTNSKDSYVMKLTGAKPFFGDPAEYLKLFETDNEYNYGFYSNKEYDELVKKVNTEMDNYERIKLSKEAEKIILKDIPAVFLFFQEREIVVSPKVKNIFFGSFGMRYYVFDAEISE